LVIELSGGKVFRFIGKVSESSQFPFNLAEGIIDRRCDIRRLLVAFKPLLVVITKGEPVFHALSLDDFQATRRVFVDV
jgi:hypothetical protein